MSQTAIFFCLKHTMSIVIFLLIDLDRKNARVLEKNKLTDNN